MGGEHINFPSQKSQSAAFEEKHRYKKSQAQIELGQNEVRMSSCKESLTVKIPSAVLLKHLEGKSNGGSGVNL